MPISQSSFLTLSTLDPLIVPVIIETGALVQISLFDPSHLSTLNSIYAEISLAHYHPSLEMREIVLAQALIGAAAALTWSGHIISEPNLFVCALTITDAAISLKLTILTNPY